jgi:beta-phosphoglucomutase
MTTGAKAFLFDLNGTMVDDMNYHLEVWYDIIVNDLGARLSKAQVKNQLFGKNEELLQRIFGAGYFSEVELQRISIDKERRYQLLYKPSLDLLPGLFRFLEESYSAGVKMAIGTAAIPFNVDFVLDTLKIRHYFDVIITADDVDQSKPHPETYLKAANLLGVTPESCIVFEDSPKGVEAAFNAGMQAVVLTTTHNFYEFDEHQNVILYVNDYNSILPASFTGKQSDSSKNRSRLASVLI